MEHMLEQLQQLCSELQSNNSSLDKQSILKKYPDCKPLLLWTYNPFKQFYITSDNLKKRKDLIGEEKSPNIITLLTMLSNRVVTGHQAVKLVNKFIEDNKQYKEIIYNIIDRDLKVRMGAKLINKAFPGLIPSFNVCLANKYLDQVDKIDLEDGTWYASRKLDGCRCITVFEGNGDISFFSREGKPFLTLDRLAEELKTLNLRDTVLDGEVCIVDEKGNEDFKSIMKEIKRKDHTIENPKYKIFDMLPFKAFDQCSYDIPLITRIVSLEGIIMEQQQDTNPYFDIVNQIKIQNQEHLQKMTNQAIANGWEGLIIRRNVGYEGKRTNNMLKVKKMQDDEYVVLDIETGLIDDGRSNKVQGVAALVIEHKGNKVSVGSGLSFDQRIKFFNDPSLIVDKTITVQYFEETVNKDGINSLRFPVLKHIYENGRDV